MKGLATLALTAVLAMVPGAAQAQAAPPALSQTPPRPQMGAEDAARHSVAAYLAQGPAPWTPEPLHRQPLAPPTFVVAADGSGTHRTLRAAVDAVPAATASRVRHVISIRPGVYRERLCIEGKAPITLQGDDADDSAVHIVGTRYNAQPKAVGERSHPCLDDRSASTHGTPGSAIVVVASDDLQLRHLTIENDVLNGVLAGQGYPPGAGESGGAQGVALLTQADRVQLSHVRLLGHQDTLMVRRPRPDQPARVHVMASLIAGDVDFVFGNATLVIERSTVLSRAGRRTPGNGGHVFAPSTPANQPHGFLVLDSRIAGEPGITPGSVSLGRAWDEGVARGAWQAGVSPNGQVLVRDSTIAPHIGPWAASTSRRPYAAAGDAANRMLEFNNRDDALDPSREVLGPRDGWAAAEGGTRGGADALPADVHLVRTRAELVAALSPHGRPRIVQVLGRIDLASGDDGRTLSEADFRDPLLDWAAFERAYDPATWGREPPTGALEDARKRSAARQAAHVVLRVPSRTTLIGVGTGAQVRGGMLLLEGVDDIIVRHLHLSDAYDHFPVWDPKDSGHGEWNSDYDTLSLRNARRVWVDHCTFDDGQRPDRNEPVRLGRRMQRHDGLLDITRQSDLVTVSWNHFRAHDKTSLVGSGDRVTADEGRLRVTYHHNHWHGVKERAPRVRYGQVHLFNNLHTVLDEASHSYSIGVGVRSRIVAQNNVWLAPATLPASRLVRWWGGTALADSGSLLNGQPVDLLATLRAAHPDRPLDADVGWLPSFVQGLEPTTGLAERVRRQAGAARAAASLSAPH